MSPILFCTAIDKIIEKGPLRKRSDTNPLKRSIEIAKQIRKFSQGRNNRFGRLFHGRLDESV